MSRTQPLDELDWVAGIVAKHPEGIAASGLLAALPEISPFNLKRRLAKLVAHRRIEMRGARKGARYFPPKAKLGRSNALELSTEGEQVRALLRGARSKKPAAPYDLDLLGAYTPNETWYLPVHERERLRALGAGGPAGMHARFLIDLAWNSARLEGSDYSLLDTQRLIAHNLAAEEKSARDAQMLLNHQHALGYLLDCKGAIAIDRPTVLSVQALLSQNLLQDPAALGTIPEALLERFEQVIAMASAISDPFEQSFFALVQLTALQPFEDLTAGVSRFIAIVPFFREGLVPISFVDVPTGPYQDGLRAVRENQRIGLLRDVYVWAYERSAARYGAVRRTAGEPDPLRMKYQNAISDTVVEVVTQAVSVFDANRRLRSVAALGIREPDQSRFIEIVETEITSLHEGNLARYRLRPEQLEEWTRRRMK